MAMLADIVGEPRGDEFLQSRQYSGCQHLGPQRVGLKLFQIDLLCKKNQITNTLK